MPYEDMNTGQSGVLMGRGKRVSQRPGNIYFRRVVNKHRKPYHDAEMSKKIYLVHTAKAVIAASHDVGGLGSCTYPI
jgi:hypothetical protein